MKIHLLFDTMNITSGAIARSLQSVGTQVKASQESEMNLHSTRKSHNL